MAEQETPDIQVPNQVINQTPTNNSWKMAFFVFLGLFLVAGLSFGAYTLGKRSPEIFKVVNQPEVTVIPTLTNEVVGWLTYTDTKYGFKFNYPSQISVQISDHDLGDGFLEAIVLNDQSKETPLSRIIDIDVFDNPKDLSLPEFEKEHTGEAGSFGFYNANAKPTTIAGKSGYLLEKIGCDPFLCQERVVVPLNKKIYLVHYFWEEDKTLFDQILSTFKFLE